MKILALLPADARHTLERSLTDSQLLSKAPGAAALIAALLERSADALVIDPGMLDSEELESVMRAVNESGVPMMMYAHLNAIGAKRIVQAVRSSARELVLRGADDSPENLRRKLAALLTPSVSAMLLSRAAGHFREFPDQLQTVSISLFGRTSLPRWVNEVVKESGLARRTVDRWMHRGGISGAGRLLDAVRLARIWEPLVDQELSLQQVVDRCGYARQRLLVAHTRRILGVEPAQLGTKFNRQTFAARLADALHE